MVISGIAMKENHCVQCGKICNSPSNRLVQDSCGHQKCRSCLLEDEENCKQCINNNHRIELNVAQIDNPIILENNHPPVIICNGTTEKNESSAYMQEPKMKNPENEEGTPVVLQNKNIDATQTNTSEFKNPPKLKHTGKAKDKRKKIDKNKEKRTYKTVTIPSNITVSLDPLMYHCKICNKSFTTKYHVKYHMYCEGVKPHKCGICQKEFILKTQLDVHMFKHNQTKSYTCNICQKSFSERSKLNRHSLLHSSIKAHVCSECGKAFRSKESLRLHSIIHNGEKPYVCKLCSAKFNNSSNLNKHLISHSQEKVHMCDQCGKTFKLKWALSVHRRSHLRIRPYNCNLCSKSFINNKDLQRHNLIHLDTKAYSCSICRTSFRRKDNLNRHMKNTHPGKEGEIIENTIETPIIKPNKPVDNPNAINVITASPAFTKNRTETKSSSRVGTTINGPLKLAFKTPEFKSNYNIHREFEYVPQPQKPYDMADSVNICQKILSPHIRTTEVCQKILSPYAKPTLHYETSFQNRKHAMIKNIKFKVPIEYTINNNTNTKTESLYNIVPLKPVSTGEIDLEPSNENHTITELNPVPSSAATTSVIVNNSALQQSSMHWRRRTSQNLNLKN